MRCNSDYSTDFLGGTELTTIRAQPEAAVLANAQDGGDSPIHGWSATHRRSEDSLPGFRRVYK